MNINAFSNMDTFDLSGAVMPPVEGVEPSEEFSGLLAEFTTMLAPAMVLPAQNAPASPDIAVTFDDFSSTADLSVDPVMNSLPAAPTTAPESEPKAALGLFFANQEALPSDSANPWSNRFGIERIKTQILEGVIEPVRETAAGLTGPPEPVSSDVGLWSGVIDVKENNAQEPVKNGPRLPPIDPNQTPPIITGVDQSPITPTGIVSSNFQSMQNRKLKIVERVAAELANNTAKTEPTRLPPRLPNEPVFEPTGVNEMPDVLPTPESNPNSTRKVDGSEFLGPPQEAVEPIGNPPPIRIVPGEGPRGPIRLYGETGGIKPIRDNPPLRETVDTGFEFATFDASEPLAIKLTPKFDGSRISGFEIKPNDLEAVIKTFESYLKPVAATDVQTDLKPTQFQAVKPAEQLATSFAEISDSIRRALDERLAEPAVRAAGIQKAAETIAEIRPIPAPFALRMKSDPASVVKPDDPAENVEMVEMPENIDILSRFTAVDEKNLAADRRVSMPQPEIFADFRRNLAEREIPEFTLDANPGPTEPVAPMRSREVSNPTGNFAAEIYSPKEIVEQVTNRLTELAKLSFDKDERPTIKLRLNPQELGTVEVMIERNDNGGLNASFRTETSEAQQALSQNLETLRETLQNAGWQVGRMDVSTGAGYSGGQNQPQSQSGETFRYGEYSNAPEIPANDAGGDNRDDRLVSLIA